MFRLLHITTAGSAQKPKMGMVIRLRYAHILPSSELMAAGIRSREVLNVCILITNIVPILGDFSTIG
jgi:hypothetical protein